MRYSNLSDEKTSLLTASEKIVFLHSVNVRNDSEDENIRLNFQIVNLTDEGVEGSYIIKNTLLEPNESQNLLALRGKADLRPVFIMPGESLLCFSNGYSQLFDCNISYQVLNEEMCETTQYSKNKSFQ